MKPIRQVAPLVGTTIRSGWVFAILIAALVFTFGTIFVNAGAEMTKKSDEANEAIISTTVAVKGTPYRVRENVTRLPSGRCATVMERFELWNGRYLKTPEVSVHARTEHSCE